MFQIIYIIHIDIITGSNYCHPGIIDNQKKLLTLQCLKPVPFDTSFYPIREIITECFCLILYIFLNVLLSALNLVNVAYTTLNLTQNIHTK